LVASRTESHLAASSLKRKERWERIARQASEQSRRLAPPEIADPTKLKELVESRAGMRIVLSEVEQEAMLKDVLESNPNADKIILALGPEGGWTLAELAAFNEAGWISASLGNTILRAETAAIAALAISLSVITSA
jgi:16S rRNA (uracil1498-N3)-methyltransferase